MGDMRPRNAIVREPGENYDRCISSHPLRHSIDIGLARRQHETYCETLASLGVRLIRLPRDDDHPDSCFVEDNAVVLGEKALICRMAKESRRGEEAEVENVLKEHVEVRRALAPATIEGGDVVHLDDKLISGVTKRTNEEGVSQMRSWLGVSIDTITDGSIVHLKSYVNYLGRGKMISTSKYARHAALAPYEVLVVPDDEWYGANSLVIGETVVMPKGFPTAKAMLEDASFEVIPLEMTEFPKCEGAMTCLSILF